MKVDLLGAFSAEGYILLWICVCNLTRNMRKWVLQHSADPCALPPAWMGHGNVLSLQRSNWLIFSFTQLSKLPLAPNNFFTTSVKNFGTVKKFRACSRACTRNLKWAGKPAVICNGWYLVPLWSSTFSMVLCMPSIALSWEMCSCLLHARAFLLFNCYKMQHISKEKV